MKSLRSIWARLRPFGSDDAADGSASGSGNAPVDGSDARTARGSRGGGERRAGSGPRGDADRQTGGGDAGERVGPALESLSDEDRVLRLLIRGEGRIERSRIAEETGWPEPRTDRVLSAMEDDGRITCVRAGGERVVYRSGYEP